jgi:hypothetical protein
MDNGPGASSENHRQASRRRALLGAKLVYGEGAYTVDCTIRDLSETGARVKLPEGQAVPDHVHLLELRTGVAYEARVVWKHHPEIGLEFLNRYDVSQASTPEMTILKRLWTESRQRSGV